ncbi:MAG: hypothetical protein KBS81_04225 [Spirochaetales bacterium]|nr:hypothetical protein [Candidatus Physcosoma equi]
MLAIGAQWESSKKIFNDIQDATSSRTMVSLVQNIIMVLLVVIIGLFPNNCMKFGPASSGPSSSFC